MSNDTAPSSLTSAFAGNSTIETAEEAGEAVDDVGDKTSSAAESRWEWDCPLEFIRAKRQIGNADHLHRISAGEVNFMAVNNAYDAAYQLQVGPYNVFELIFRFNNSWKNFNSPASLPLPHIAQVLSR